MHRTIEMIEQAEGPIHEALDFEGWLKQGYTELGQVENVVYDEPMLNVKFNVVGDGWKATVTVDEGKSGSVIIHDTASEHNATIATYSFDEAEDTGDALSMAFAFIAADEEAEPEPSEED